MALRRRRIPGRECGPAHLAVHTRDLGLIADRGERLERLAVEGDRTCEIALRKRHLGQEAER